MSDLETARIQIVKAILDEFPRVRAWVRGYLETYYPR